MIKVKTCTKCKIEKSSDEFYKRSEVSKDGKKLYKYLQPSCKKCWKAKIQHKRDTIPGFQKNVDLKHNFGITLDDYNEMLKKQDYKCEVCLRHESEFKRKLSVDHNHTTGKIRGLLCSLCNTALGKLKEDKEVINRLLNYIDKYNNSKE